MSEDARPLKVLPTQKVKYGAPVDRFRSRESEELVVGFCGPIGAGIGLATQLVEEVLSGHGYTVKRIKLSHFIKQYAAKQKGATTAELEDKANRYTKLQTHGNELREKLGDDVLAQIAVAAIAYHRESSESLKAKDTPTKNAFLIDQIKHPAEIALLRTIYRNLFFLVGVLSAYEHRKKFLVNLGIPRDQAEFLIERDKKESLDHGQQLDKALRMSDLFIRNGEASDARIRAQIERFFGLLHGTNGITPTVDEHAMYIAYSASLGSACLSRQVGAAITDANGNILSTGCNDVPKPGGGLYTAGDRERDQRCYNKGGGRCFNDDEKNKLTEEISRVLISSGVEKSHANSLAQQIKADTRLRDILEFSRSVHAEMDAIVRLARTGGVSVRGGSLYTTTFPCHNCARHIVASGISTVHYIEPYEKSLALELHGDAIVSDPEDVDGTSDRVRFLHFEGVAPRQFLKLFNSNVDRKNKDGRKKQNLLDGSPKTVVEYLDSYFDFESKVFKHVKEELEIAYMFE